MSYFDKIYAVTPINDDVLRSPAYNDLYTQGFKIKLATDYFNAPIFDSYVASNVSSPVMMNGYTPTLDESYKDTTSLEDNVQSYLKNNIANIIIFEMLAFGTEVLEEAEVTGTEYDNIMNLIYAKAVEFLYYKESFSCRNNGYIENMIAGQSYCINLYLQNEISMVPGYLVEPIILDMYKLLVYVPNACKNLYAANIDEDTSGLADGITASGWQAITSILRSTATEHVSNMYTAAMMLKDPVEAMIAANSGIGRKYVKYSSKYPMEEYVREDPIILEILGDDDEEE